MRVRLSRLAARLVEIDGLLAREDAIDDLDQYRRISRERAEIEPVVRRYEEFEAAQSDLAAAQQMLSDPELRALGEEEGAAAQARSAALEESLQRLLLPVDPNDERNVFLEIRAGTGGEESALFAATLLRMYLRFAERRRWQSEIVSSLSLIHI